MALATKPRWDKTNPYVGNHRAHLAADIPEALFNKVIATGKNGQGNIVVGAGQTGVDGLMIVAVGQDIHGELLDGGINNMAGDPQDVGHLGEITNFEPNLVGAAANAQPQEEAGKIYYGHPDGSVIAATGPGAVVVGRTAEKDRLIVMVDVGGAGTIQDSVPRGGAASGGTGQATLAWTPVKGATGYKIQKSSDGTNFVAGNPATSTSTTSTQTGLAAGTWHFKVLATVDGVDSAYSTAFKATVV